MTETVTPSDIEGPDFQAPEWPLLVGTYSSLSVMCPSGAADSIDCGSSTSYTWEGIGFNTAREYINNVLFRQAISYLTNYQELQSDALLTVEGSATPFDFPCSIYTGYCFSPITGYTYSYSLLDAANDLLGAGLIAGLCSTAQSGTAPPTCTPSSFVQSPGVLTSAQLLYIGGWYMSQNPTCQGCTNTTSNGLPGGQNCAAPTSSWTSAVESACFFSPTLYYRNDDPLRTAGALELTTTANEIGFTINGHGITDAEAAPTVYDPAAASIITSGKFAGDVNSSDVNGTSAADTWDMYTFGWVLSDYGPEDAFFFFNRALLGTTDNFVDFNNPTVNTATSQIYDAKTLPAVASAMTPLGEALQTQLPYLTWWYESNLWAVNSVGWTGFANVAMSGPDTSSGIYYTALNAHSTASGKGYGGNLNYILHDVADPSGMNPLYNTNWVWQADVWSELYDSPLQASPTQITSINSFTNWMTTNYVVANFSGMTPSGTGVSDFQDGQLPSGAPNDTAQSISGGESITFDFRNNMTFSDNVPITAADYNFSLFAWDLAGQSWTPDLSTPDSSELAGPAGLIADYVNSANNSITVYLGSDTVWNLAETIVPVLSAGLFKYFNIDEAATLSGTLDISQPYATAIAGCTWTTSCLQKGLKAAPNWVQYLPNLEVTSGPLNLQTFDPKTGSGIMAANLNYQRSAWLVNATDNNVGASPASVSLGGTGSQVVLSPLREYVYNAGADPGFSSSTCTPSCSTGSEGWVYIPGGNVTSTSIQVYSVRGESSTPESGVTGKAVCNSVGQCSATISGTSSLPSGDYEVVFHANFSFLGLVRSWYQFTGFSVSAGPSTTTSSASSSMSSQSSSTSSSSSTRSGIPEFPFQLSLVTAATLAVVAAYALLRRPTSRTFRV